MFKVTEFYVRGFSVSDGPHGPRRTPVGQARRTRDEGEARQWAEDERRRLALKGGAANHEVLVYSVIGEPMFDLWAEPRVCSRLTAGKG